jgi:serine/threonine protein kinase
VTNRAHHSDEESVAERLSAERPTPERSSPERAAAERSSPERSSPERTLAELVAPGPLSAERPLPESAARDRAPPSSGPVLEITSSRELTEELLSAGLESLDGIATSSVRPDSDQQEDVQQTEAARDAVAAPVDALEERLDDELPSQPMASAARPVGEPTDEAPAVPMDSTRSGPFAPPWVDEVPDPVTPYEQRVSETIKLADLPPIEQVRGHVLANRYLAEELAEQSAASLSYRAYHLALDRAVTLRILPRGLACSDELCQEVRRVARVASLLNHPNIASTLDFGVTSDGWPFVVTEHFQGRTLALLLAEEGKFVLRRVLHIGKQLAAGLSAAHQAGVVHGFVSPDNVLVVEPGTSAEVAIVLGFGVSSARGPTPAPPRSGVFGVPFYVSPEQASCRPLDARSYIYSLGVLLYELMTGAPPFSDGDFAAVLCQHLDDDAEAPSTRLKSPGPLAKAMDAIVARCLRKEPEQRYQTAGELADDLIRLEAAAARTKRRPMPEIQRPTTTIHSPPPRAADNAMTSGAKVIIHAEEPTPARASPIAQDRRSSPGSVPPPTAASVAASALRPVTKRPARVSVDQATIKISAMDRELAMALHRRTKGHRRWTLALRGFVTALLASLTLMFHRFARGVGMGRRRSTNHRGNGSPH